MQCFRKRNDPFPVPLLGCDPPVFQSLQTNYLKGQKVIKKHSSPIILAFCTLQSFFVSNQLIKHREIQNYSSTFHNIIGIKVRGFWLLVDKTSKRWNNCIWSWNFLVKITHTEGIFYYIFIIRMSCSIPPPFSLINLYNKTVIQMISSSVNMRIPNLKCEWC